MSKTSIGLDKKASEKLAAKLNELLATYQVFYTNVRGYHWNIKGVNFFELHAKFEEIYTDLVEKVDEVAERIFPLHSPFIDHIELVTEGSVRRSRLYYLRDLKGKAARIKPKKRY